MKELNNYTSQHVAVIKGIKKSLPSAVTFLSLYSSEENGYCVRAIVEKQEYFFSLDPNSFMTMQDADRLRNLITDKYGQERS